MYTNKVTILWTSATIYSSNNLQNKRTLYTIHVHVAVEGRKERISFIFGLI